MVQRKPNDQTDVLQSFGTSKVTSSSSRAEPNRGSREFDGSKMVLVLDEDDLQDRSVFRRPD
ncbi:hypothetical protein B0E45_17310 [Sinorhizobium sp. A49]|nr:hypothetical protein B0E45_17310 [Sinorhizobium sp. A49]